MTKNINKATSKNNISIKIDMGTKPRKQNRESKNTKEKGQVSQEQIQPYPLLNPNLSPSYTSVNVSQPSPYSYQPEFYTPKRQIIKQDEDSPIPDGFKMMQTNFMDVLNEIKNSDERRENDLQRISEIFMENQAKAKNIDDFVASGFGGYPFYAPTQSTQSVKSEEMPQQNEPGSPLPITPGTGSHQNKVLDINPTLPIANKKRDNPYIEEPLSPAREQIEDAPPIPFLPNIDDRDVFAPRNHDYLMRRMAAEMFEQQGLPRQININKDLLEQGHPHEKLALPPPPKKEMLALPEPPVGFAKGCLLRQGSEPCSSRRDFVPPVPEPPERRMSEYNDVVAARELFKKYKENVENAKLRNQYGHQLRTLLSKMGFQVMNERNRSKWMKTLAIEFNKKHGN
jgi:hypothetical protein